MDDCPSGSGNRDWRISQLEAVLRAGALKSKQASDLSAITERLKCLEGGKMKANAGGGDDWKSAPYGKKGDNEWKKNKSDWKGKSDWKKEGEKKKESTSEEMPKCGRYSAGKECAGNNCRLKHTLMSKTEWDTFTQKYTVYQREFPTGTYPPRIMTAP
jgi:hypothetical protein